MQEKIAGLLLAAVACSGCGALPPSHIYTGTAGYINDGYAPEGLDAGARGAAANEGRDFCRDLENRARVRAVQQLGTGWTAGIAAVLLVGAGTVATAATPDNPSKGRIILNASLPLTGAALGYLAFGEFTREQNASQVAATASKAINLEDREANIACNEALASWNSSRPNSNDALVKGLQGKEHEAPPADAPKDAAPTPAPAPAAPAGSSTAKGEKK